MYDHYDLKELVSLASQPFEVLEPDYVTDSVDEAKTLKAKMELIENLSKAFGVLEEALMELVNTITGSFDSVTAIIKQLMELLDKPADEPTSYAPVLCIFAHANGVKKLTVTRLLIPP